MTKKYSLGLVGRKAGMSRVFTDDGRSIPVTLIEATPNRITQVKTVETDGYSALQVTAVLGGTDENGKHMVEIEQEAQNQDGEQSAVGGGVVVLPSRG